MNYGEVTTNPTHSLGEIISPTERKNEFKKAAFSDNRDHPNDIVFVYMADRVLQPAFRREATQELVALYIKVTFPCSISSIPMIILSFHEANLFD